MRKRFRSVFCLALLALPAISFCSHLCLAQEISVAAAADLQFAMQDIATRFQKETGKTRQGHLRFIRKLSATDPEWSAFRCLLFGESRLSEKTGGCRTDGARKLFRVRERQDRDLGAERFENRFESWTEGLTRSSVKKIAIANPLHAPYGQAAVAALKHENIYDNVKNKFVLGENISQTASFVVSGAADIGIVALSLALSPNMKDKGRYIEVPPRTIHPSSRRA